MIRVDAMANSTEMIEFQTGLDRPDESFPCHAVDADLGGTGTTATDGAVSPLVGVPLPEPAGASRVHLRPQAISQWRGWPPRH